MRFDTTHIGLAVLLALVLGYASVSVHVATHIADDATECRLCLSYGDASESIEQWHGHGVPAGVDTATPTAKVAFQPRTVLKFNRQRAPPLIS